MVNAGFVVPARGPRQEWRFKFADVVLLRSAYELQAAKIPPRRIIASLQRAREQLPEHMPLTGLRIAAIGGDVVVSEGANRWSAESGQLVMDFEVSERGSLMALRPKAAAAADAPTDARAWFERGEALEADDPSAAEAAYRQALALDVHAIDACLNLGALLCDLGRSIDAVKVYDRGIAAQPAHPDLHFNRAIALEDAGDIAGAIASYERCLQLEPEFADAHFNAARLYEQRGDPQQAIRHLGIFRRLEQGMSP